MPSAIKILRITHKVRYQQRKADFVGNPLSKYQFYYIKQDSVKYGNDWSQGVTFSPNDSLLYVNTHYGIWQIDINNTDYYSSFYIAGPDTSDLDYFPLYGVSALTPNGKIYIGNKNGVRKTMSFIDKPNVKGLGCNFTPQGLSQPFTNLMVPPNMPNYGLGALAGSPCDTIRAQPSQWLLYPNPASTSITLLVPNSIINTNIAVNIYDMLGKLVFSTQANTNFEHKANIALPNMAHGVYVIKAKNGTDEFVSRFVKE